MTDSPNLNNDTELRFLCARADADRPDGRIIRSGAKIYLSKEWGVRFDLANIPPDQTHLLVFRDGVPDQSFPVRDDLVIRLYRNSTSTELINVVAYAGTGEPTEPSTETFVIHWVKDDDRTTQED